ncbi:HlyD family efflux transporter periplasmic adaptor subunit [Candidatus Ozemobacteraceae bacterium]|nr:HlyD family efflux transporter periplasmic adaptor subunit [Candidatus Ozemobacteraceae bacterium]
MSDITTNESGTTVSGASFTTFIRKTAPLGIAGILLTAFLAVGLMKVAGLRAEQATAAKPVEAVRMVRTAVPTEGEVIRTIPVLATLKSAAGIRLQAEIAGRLISLKCREGDRVVAGQELATIDGRESMSQMKAAAAQSRAAANQSQAMAANLDALTNKLASARANAEYLEAERTRSDNLLEVGAISQSQRDAAFNRAVEARSALRSLESQIESARAQRSALASQQQAAQETTTIWKVRAGYATLTSPVSGIISARLQEEGQFVGAGAPVYVIEDDRQTRLLMQVPQDRAGALKPGLDVLVDLPGNPGGEPPAFRISRVYPALNEHRQLGVEAIAGGPVSGVPYDMQIPARIITARQKGLVFSPDLLFPDMNGQGGYVAYEVSRGRAVRRPIQPIIIGDSGAALVAGGSVGSGTRFLSGAYLEHIRLPASFQVEVVQ